MRAFVSEVDNHGLRRLLPEELLPTEELARLARVTPRRLPAIVWALLEEPDADDLRAEVGAGRHRDALGMLLNRAVEILPLDAAATVPSREDL